MSPTMSLKWQRAGLALVLLAGLVSLASPARADDVAMKQKVEEHLRKAKLETQGEVDVDVNNGLVTLTGAVATVDAQRDAEKAALEVSRMVDNRIKVLPEKRSDVEIRKAVREAVLRYVYYSVFDDVEFAVEDGAVLLRGSVYRPNRRTDIDNLVAKIPGVREVQNEIDVQPASFFDDQLRRELVRTIYGRLSQYGNQPNPSIHIIVNRGTVTLTGYVNSRVDQALLGVLARETLAFNVTNQVKVEGQSSAEDRKPEPQADSQ